METLDPMMLPMAPWPKEMVQACRFGWDFTGEGFEDG